MNSMLIKPSILKGTITPPPSKSLSHRAIICASLCNDGQESCIDNVILSDDIEATIYGMKQLGAKIEMIQNGNNIYSLHIKGNNNQIIKNANINCRESGSTLRFLIPIALILSETSTFIGQGKLTERPLDIYYKIFDQYNIKYKNTNGKLPLYIHGNLQDGIYELSGKVSSQFISGLLFALPLLHKDSVIKITDKLESIGYVDLTLDILKKFNVIIDNYNYKEFIIHENSQYNSINYTVESDFSQAAFFLTAKQIGNNINCVGLNNNSLQGDKEIIHIIEKFNSLKDDEILIDASQIPDLVPILTVLGALKNNITTKIINAERLRIKESDRLKAIATEMNKLGANIIELEDGLLIKGQSTLKGNAKVNSWNDHRIAMSLAIAATKCQEEIILENYTAVNKSYPQFWDDYKSLGGAIIELNLGK
ncbi:MAG: 3-phosphoshikimate 1-carboxyvinyltransferase [Tissierellia bacterium]|nr:3-phosphoshikimate 1-carboxyvinyltransferase [Tissierellia bacterium]